MKNGCRVLIIVCMFMMMIMMMLLGMASASATSPTAFECKRERKLAVNACKSVLYRRYPSSYCCERVRVSHVECICPAITPRMAAIVDVNRFVRLIQGCGRRVPRHFKCGSVTSP